MFTRKPKKDLIFDTIMQKYQIKEKLTYEEYVILLSTNDEAWFIHGNAEYQIDHSDAKSTSMYKTEYINDKKIIQKCGVYNDIIDLLINFKINDKRLVEIWDEISFKQ